MSSEHGSFQASDHLHIYYSVWKPTSMPPKAKVLAFHGLGEHIHRYDHVFTKFAESGILVKGMDIRGFGRTAQQNPKSKRGWLSSLEQVFQDMLTLDSLQSIENERSLPTFVFGHSMGGVLALKFAASKKLKLHGVIAQAPAILPFDSDERPLTQFKHRMVEYCCSGIFGKITISQPTDATKITGDKGEQERFLADPLIQRDICLKTVYFLITMPKSLKKQAVAIDIPIYIIHSAADRWAGIEGSRSFFASVTSKDKTLIDLPISLNLQHEIHNEPTQSESISSGYISWILERL
ncbi:Alpha/Beta hydrolase protein [Obelidium mucronatum]|nr:Alpha/Beta hydrolase protein [Obelidium mucronatum]